MGAAGTTESLFDFDLYYVAHVAAALGVARHDQAPIVVEFIE